MLDEAKKPYFLVAENSHLSRKTVQIDEGPGSDHHSVLRTFFNESPSHYFLSHAQMASLTSSNPMILRSPGNMKNVGQVGILLGKPYW